MGAFLQENTPIIMMRKMHNRPQPDPLQSVLLYHQRTKHHLQRYAASLGYLDWDTQPDPFRRYRGSPLIRLEQPAPSSDDIPYDDIFSGLPSPPRPLCKRTLSQFFYDSLALSAWKVAGSSRWSLRVNPSSGNLHPTEAYLIAPPIERICDRPALYHYAAHEHALERRATLDAKQWQRLTRGLPEGAFLIGLSSIYWRESWKYGERAFRYCMHDAGHAIGALAVGGAVLGWQAALLETVSDQALARLLGVHEQRGMEAEHPDALMVFHPGHEQFYPARYRLEVAPDHLEGTPNQLSSDHYPWLVIDEVSSATERKTVPDSSFWHTTPGSAAPPPLPAGRRKVAARTIIRQRRSAVAMDGRTTINADQFYLMLRHTLPAAAIFDPLPWSATVALALFVHRVESLEPGLYLFLRDPEQEGSLRKAITGDFLFQHPEGCPDDLHLFLLQATDCRDAAKKVSCHQDIAADGVFSLGMLAHFEPGLQRTGPWFYKRLFWETGLIGQILYLEAEAAGIRSTGIGCFFDDAMHQILGLKDLTWQSLYHFTVGGPVDDPRLQTRPAYEHLSG